MERRGSAMGSKRKERTLKGGKGREEARRREWREGKAGKREGGAPNISPARLP